MAGQMKEEIRAFIVQQFARARTLRVADDDQLIETGILDSLGVLDLVAFLERTYAIEISEDDLVMRNFQTIDRISSFVGEKRSP